MSQFIPNSSLQNAPVSTPADAPNTGRAAWFGQATNALGTLSSAFATIYGSIKGTNPQSVTINQPNPQSEGQNATLMYVLIGLSVVVVLVLIYLATRKK
jgi:hypothetical protein